MRLSDFSAVQCTTVRANLRDLGADEIVEGVGVEGDVVLARVLDPGGITAVVDWCERKHTVASGDLVLGVLANRDSTIHASGRVPEGGIVIKAGTPLSWLGGQSGLFGIQTWSPAVDNPQGAQASGAVEALGLLADADGPVNMTSFSRSPTAKHAIAPLIVVCGSSAEVGKTTIACRVISHLTRRPDRVVVAIKPTGSGGITDSLAHRRAGAAATFDLVDCGLPSSYTNSQRFSARISRCLLYANEHQPDVVVCELGGDLIWGNNDTFLRETRHLIVAVLCVAGDATAALGIHAFLSDAGLSDLSVAYAPSYTRNPYTFAERLRRHLGPAKRVLKDDSDNEVHAFLEDAGFGTGQCTEEEG